MNLKKRIPQKKSYFVLLLWVNTDQVKSWDKYKYFWKKNDKKQLPSTLNIAM